MTAERAIEILETSLYGTPEDLEEYGAYEYSQAIREGIRSLKREPSTDAVKKILDEYHPKLVSYENYYTLIALEAEISELPPVTPERPKMDKADKYKKVAMDLLTEYLESEQAVISEFSGDFKKSAAIFKKQVMKYLKRLDEGEDTFNKLVKDMWIADYYKAESEG